jgi:hypothetical protein
MVQGKFKTKATMPKGCKQRSQQRIDKGNVKKKNTKQKKNSIETIVKNKLEASVKKNIEHELCGQAKSIEGKSFRVVKS